MKLIGSNRKNVQLPHAVLLCEAGLAHSHWIFLQKPALLLLCANLKPCFLHTVLHGIKCFFLTPLYTLSALFLQSRCLLAVSYGRYVNNFDSREADVTLPTGCMPRQHAWVGCG
ncbi:hypothetical protein ILYODFUR_009146 [Ilyodon furcidens]|uniref:Uncharacterized protein n=1 Tax=Ilyodon furcidens TaxID=33524 RepID=A0ABV0SLY0_9TELE